MKEKDAKITIYQGNKLKGCPFCGEKPQAYCDEDYGFYVGCDNWECGMGDSVGRFFRCEADALKIWNNRSC